MARAISINQLLNTSRKVMDFEGDWLAAIGRPEVKGAVLVWGDSGQGKTSFVLQFARYIASFERVLFDSLEEGDSLSMELAFRRQNMMEVNGKVVLLDKEPIAELMERLDKPKSPNVVIIDSLQYSGLRYEDYKTLIDRYRKKLFVFVSHADGREPSGKVAMSIKYDAHIKVRVDGFMAYCNSRYGGGEPYTISEEKASRIYPK